MVKTTIMTGAEAKNTGNKTNKKATKKEWKGVKNHPLIEKKWAEEYQNPEADFILVLLLYKSETVN